jgi:hypothetical protein
MKVFAIFGSSKGLEFKEHIKKLNICKKWYYIYEKLFEESEQYILDDTTSLWYEWFLLYVYLWKNMERKDYWTPN